MVDEPLVIKEGRVTALERVRQQIEDLRQSEFFESQPPDIQAFMVLFNKDGLPSAHPEGEYIPIITPIEESLARRFLHLSFEEGHQVVAVEEQNASSLHKSQIRRYL